MGSVFGDGNPPGQDPCQLPCLVCRLQRQTPPPLFEGSRRCARWHALPSMQWPHGATEPHGATRSPPSAVPGGSLRVVHQGARVPPVCNFVAGSTCVEVTELRCLHEVQAIRIAFPSRKKGRKGRDSQTFGCRSSALFVFLQVLDLDLVAA